MSNEVRIALISDDSKVNNDLRMIFSKQLGQGKEEELRLKIYTSLPSVEEAIVHYAPHLIIVHIEPDHLEEKQNFLESLSRISTRIPIIVSAPVLDADLMLACVKKGVRDFLKQPFHETEIHEMMGRLLRETAIGAQERQMGLTYIFFSYKGGVGTTFLSCNTAVSLARLTNARVLLWDLVIQNGDVPFFFDYEPNATLSDLLENASRIDDNYLRGTLPVNSSGISILAGPKRPEEAEAIRNDQIQSLHQTLRKYYDYIVIDGGHSLTDHIIATMDVSKYIMLTTDLHLPVLKNTLRCLEVFERLGYVEGKFKILLNRYNSKYEKFDLSKAQEILHYPIAFAFSNDYFTVSRSLNTGIPVAELDKNSVLSKQFDELARDLVNNFKVSDDSGSSFVGKLRGFLPAKKKKAASPYPPEKEKAEKDHAA